MQFQNFREKLCVGRELNNESVTMKAINIRFLHQANRDRSQCFHWTSQNRNRT